MEYVDLLYLVSIVLFITGLKRLSHPETARKGNLIAAAGMGVGIIASLIVPLEGSHGNYAWIALGIALGSTVGLVAAKKIKMTAMPEMVSLFNGLGGACAMLISVSEFITYPEDQSMMTGQMITTLFALFIGSISFTGSIMAWGKLNGSLRDNIKLPAPMIINLLLLVAVIVLSVLVLLDSEPNFLLFGIILAISLLYGFTFVSPIGGGDMPVVISLLNSFTGIGAALAGIIYGNMVMIVGGILVGASGTILTVLMCEAMNRSLINVIIGGMGGSSGSAAAAGDQVIKEATVNDTAISLKYASKVLVVPGYGLAVAQAQHTIHELEQLLEKEGVEVRYAIHPVAGRMPGHMNVLLAEADVPYPNLLEMEAANKELATTDVVLVIGANDVVNPAAKSDPGSPIYGMPVLEVELAKQVIVMKRSMNKGYAGIENPLFFGERTKMLFGDAKQSISKLVSEVGNV